MVDAPREVIGAVLKSMGASYNTSNIDSEVAGGRNAVRAKLAQLQKQVYKCIGEAVLGNSRHMQAGVLGL